MNIDQWFSTDVQPRHAGVPQAFSQVCHELLKIFFYNLE